MRTLSFAMIVLAGVVLAVTAGWWVMMRAHLERRARKAKVAVRQVECRSSCGEGAAVVGPGEAPGRPLGWGFGSHDEVRIALGAFVLGALDAREASTVEKHLLDCWTCCAELSQFAALPRLLGRLSAAEVVAGLRAD